MKRRRKRNKGRYNSHLWQVVGVVGVQRHRHAGKRAEYPRETGVTVAAVGDPISYNYEQHQHQYQRHLQHTPLVAGFLALASRGNAAATNSSATRWPRTDQSGWNKYIGYGGLTRSHSQLMIPPRPTRTRSWTRLQRLGPTNEESQQYLAGLVDPETSPGTPPTPTAGSTKPLYETPTSRNPPGHQPQIPRQMTTKPTQPARAGACAVTQALAAGGC